jgi:hypothetical protein
MASLSRTAGKAQRFRVLPSLAPAPRAKPAGDPSHCFLRRPSPSEGEVAPRGPPLGFPASGVPENDKGKEYFSFMASHPFYWFPLRG